ncbi:unnamed protein product [Zymoseptoria tritici ST99CH_3D7]|uniref:Uncharacterized protein n=1 Tax=Zymoseptoria tritici (strain ST99CH_3D7) TaxID=1276538 RepID=A0A1X7RYP5_ZYMT9|nr:unnamed protein product [Zymoseptoria tritici ST99CH_3D7]
MRTARSWRVPTSARGRRFIGVEIEFAAATATPHTSSSLYCYPTTATNIVASADRIARERKMTSFSIYDATDRTVFEKQGRENRLTGHARNDRID